MTAKKKSESAEKLPSFNELFARALDKEADGVWTEIPSFAGPITIKLRSTNAPGVMEVLNKARSKHKGIIRQAERNPDNMLLQKQSAEANLLIMKETIVNAPLITDWKGIGDSEGKPLPCTKENLKMCLEAEGLDGFILAVFTAANRADTFKNPEDLEDSEKN
jgi:hypothetical protein